MPKDLQGLFSPKSVCVIGASQSLEKVGGIILKNIIDSKFTGKVYPVNPKGEIIDGLQSFVDLESLPEVPDLAIVAIPAGLVVEELEKIGKKGIKNVVVVSSGFKEAGVEGEKLEKGLVDVASKYGFNLMGPNCMGFINNALPINATFGQAVSKVGNLRFITQSGAIASSIFDWCNKTGLGLSEFVTLGNKAVFNENDVLEYFNSSFKSGEGVHPVGLYLESISNGQDFLRIAGEMAKANPIFVIKAGKTKEAAKAIHSHTGSIAGEDSVTEAAFEQTGVIRCQTLEDFFDISRAFAWEDAPKGGRVAIISNAGGPAVICADAVVNEGLTLAEFDEATKEELRGVLPHFASVGNPVDVLGDALADRYASAAEIILKTDAADALVVILTPQVMTQIEKTAEMIGGLKKYGKPIFCAFMGGSLIEKGEQKLNELEIPSFRFPERAISTIGIMWRWRERMDLDSRLHGNDKGVVIEVNNDVAKGVIDGARKNGRKTLDNFESNDILKSFGIPTPATEVIMDLNQAKNFAEIYSWPVVLKLSSPGLLHKKDIGGVVTDISNNWQLEIVWDNYQRKIATLDEDMRGNVKIQMQKEVLNGIEVIVGVKRDPVFGPVLLFGAGGTYAELLVDRNLHLLPMNLEQAKELVDKSKIALILKGYRGEPAYALDKLYECIVRLSKIVESNPDIEEIEINPLIVTLNNVWAVDGKVILREGVKRVISAPAFKVATTLSHDVLAAKFHYMVFEPEQPLVHKPGQYVSVKVSNQRLNCYSIATDEGEGKFGLLIDSKPGGVGSKFFENVKEGDKITYLGAFGTFTFKPDDGAKRIIFMGTGSGAAPLRCMIDDMIKNNTLTRPIYFYLGLRFTTDVFWNDYFKGLAEKYPDLIKYKLVLSQPDESWQGLMGHITDVAKADFPDASDCAAYMCGNKHMIEEATAMFATLGCPKERIYSEKF